MCGIAGLYSPHQPIPAEHIGRMLDRLSHRGPDGQGIYNAPGVALGHARLSIIDLAGGGQPLFNEDKSLVLVANGEVYNYVELRAELEALGHRFATHSDCETLLHGYEAWGEDILQRAFGMYAFALHDARRGSVWLARDRLGIKPLYLARTGDGWAFASEIKGLLPVLGNIQVNPLGLAQFLQFNFVCAPTSPVAGVESLRPGESLWLHDVSSRRCYWTPAHVMPRRIGFDEAAEAFDALVDQVMDIHLRSDVPFGLFLSGGVDSSLLLALLSAKVKEPMATWSVGFPDSSVHNELALAASTAARFGAKHTALAVTAEDMLERLPHSVWAADSLMGDYANLPVSLLAERASGKLKVVFSGEGGDEAFAGYGRYRVLRLKRLWRRLRDPGSGGFRTHGMFSGIAAGLFAPELANALPHWRDPVIEAWRELPANMSDLAHMQAVDMAHWLPDDLLAKADRMLMAWGVEGRVPWLDHRVVEFGLSLPDGLKVDGRTGKLFLKRWGERHLPREFLMARKKGFTVPVRDWLRGERLDRLAKILPDQPGLRAWFVRDGITRLLRQQQSTGRYSQQVWAMLNFAIWHRIFVEGDGSPPPARQDPITWLAR